MSSNVVELNKRNTWQEVMDQDNASMNSPSNFYLHFSHGWVGSMYRKREVFERLSIAKPDLVEICLQSGNEFTERKKTREDHYQTIFPAYEFMEQNVLLTDKYVVKDGKVDRDYLFR